MRPTIMIRLGHALMLLTLGVLSPRAAVAQPAYITIGTGGTTGLYYAVGQTLCRMLQNTLSGSSSRCYALSTAGSADNIQRLQAGQLLLGLAQSDTQAQAVQGGGVFGQPQDKLRAIASLYAEPLALMVRSDAGIQTPAQLKGKRINIGPQGSGQHNLGRQVFQALGFTPANLQGATLLGPDQHAGALCSRQIDAFVYAIAHPSTNILAAAEDCQAKLLSLDEPTIAAVTRANPALRPARIAANSYPHNHVDVLTLGPVATLLTASSQADETVYQLTRSIFERLDQLRAVHPALAGLQPPAMIQDGLSAPLHPGAARYYREQGWMR